MLTRIRCADRARTTGKRCRFTFPEAAAEANRALGWREPAPGAWVCPIHARVEDRREQALGGRVRCSAQLKGGARGCAGSFPADRASEQHRRAWVQAADGTWLCPAHAFQARLRATKEAS